MAYRVGKCKVCGHFVNVHENGVLRDLCEHVKSIKDVALKKRKKKTIVSKKQRDGIR